MLQVALDVPYIAPVLLFLTSSFTTNAVLKTKNLAWLKQNGSKVIWAWLKFQESHCWLENREKGHQEIYIDVLWTDRDLVHTISRSWCFKMVDNAALFIFMEQRRFASNLLNWLRWKGVKRKRLLFNAAEAPRFQRWERCQAGPGLLGFWCHVATISKFKEWPLSQHTDMTFFSIFYPDMLFQLVAVSRVFMEPFGRLDFPQVTQVVDSLQDPL